MDVNRNTDNDEPRYVISIVSRMLGIQTHTLRYYEKVGIIEPSRSQGNMRLYSEKDIVMLRRAKTLIAELGVNLAGAEVILRMSQHMSELQNRIEELESRIQKLREGG